MRVEFEKTAQTLLNRHKEEPIGDEIPSQTGFEQDPQFMKNTRMADLAANALEFVGDFLLDFELPSSPKLQLNYVRGFESSKRSFLEVTGVVYIGVEFSTNINASIRFTLPIPVRHGTFIKPAVVYYSNRTGIFSQDFIDEIVSSLDTNTVKVQKPFNPSISFNRYPNVQKPLFSAPDDPSGWSLLVTERY
jgi:hypothetical protein